MTDTPESIRDMAARHHDDALHAMNEKLPITADACARRADALNRYADLLEALAPTHVVGDETDVLYVAPAATDFVPLQTMLDHTPGIEGYVLTTPGGKTVLATRHKTWVETERAAREAGFPVDAIIRLEASDLLQVQRAFGEA